jgi:glycosyltransferase involved in cell wall biosynthesis
LLVINGGFPAGETCICASIAWYLATGRKSWHNFHNYAFPYNSIFYPLQFIHDLIFKRTVEGMISVSNDCAHSITARNGLNGVKTKFIYNGLNIHPVNRTSNIRTELSISSDAKVIIMLATYEERKGHSFLFEAFELFKENNVHLIICGTGSLAEKEVMSFNKREVSNHTNIHILGHRDDSYELISQSDLVVIPSKSHESFGLTIIEAMALKVPVISTSVGGMPEVIENGVSGFTVKYGDTNGFYKKMKKALFDMELKSNLVVSGVERYKSMFTANVMAESYAKLIKEKK